VGRQVAFGGKMKEIHSADGMNFIYFDRYLVFGGIGASIKARLVRLIPLAQFGRLLGYLGAPHPSTRTQVQMEYFLLNSMFQILF
jgi:hypothetical protein